MTQGVEARGNSIRVCFRFNGKRYRELIPGGNTAANREQAQRLVNIIEYEIQAGTFNYSRHFPNSANLVENTFGHYLDLWLKIKSNSVAATSYRGYANKAEVHVRPRWGKVQFDQIDHLDLQEWVQDTLSTRLKKLMIQFMIWAGPRVSETIALAWEDVDLQHGTVTFRRSKVRGA